MLLIAQAVEAKGAAAVLAAEAVPLLVALSEHHNTNLALLQGSISRLGVAESTPKSAALCFH